MMVALGFLLLILFGVFYTVLMAACTNAKWKYGNTFRTRWLSVETVVIACWLGMIGLTAGCAILTGVPWWLLPVAILTGTLVGRKLLHSSLDRIARSRFGS